MSRMIRKKTKITKDLMYFEWGDEPTGYVSTWRRLKDGKWELGPVITKEAAWEHHLRMECPYS